MREKFLRSVAPFLFHCILLFLALFGTIFSFVGSFSLPVFRPFLLKVCFLTAVAAVGVCLPGKRSHRLALYALWLCGLLWVAWGSLPTLIQGGLVLGRQVSTLYVARLPGLVVSPYFSAHIGGLTFAQQQAACTLLLTLFAAALALFLGWTVTVRRKFWAGFWVTFPPLVLPLMLTVTPPWPPLMALVLYWSVGLLTRLTARRDPRGTARLGLVAVPLMALLLFGTEQALPRAHYTQSAWARAVRLEVTQRLLSVGQSLTGGSLAGLAGGSVDVNLSAAGPLSFTGKTALRVQSEVGGHLYLRGFSAGHYTASGWSQLPDGTVYPDFEGYQPLNFPALADRAAFPATPACRVEIETVGAAAAYAFTPYQLLTTPQRMSGAKFVNDAYVARSTGVWRYLFTARTGASPESTPHLTGEAYRAELGYAMFVQEHYLQVPRHLVNVMEQALYGDGSFALRGLPGDIIYDGSLPVLPPLSEYPVAAARAVADYLATHAVYDPETPVTPPGEDFIAHFLTEKRGYCMHFASAATMMLRSLGVPARYTTGYVADVTPGVVTDVPDYNAHAWVEVYCAGYGWQPVEVTPGFTGDFSWEREDATVPAAATAAPKPSQAPRPEVSTPPTESAPPAPPAEEGGLNLLLPAAVAAGVVLLALLRQWLAAAVRKRRFHGADRNRAVIEIYLYAARLLRHLPCEEMDGAMQELAEAAKFSCHRISEAQRQQALAYVRALRARTERSLGLWGRLVLRYVYGL